MSDISLPGSNPWQLLVLGFHLLHTTRSSCIRAGRSGSAISMYCASWNCWTVSRAVEWAYNEFAGGKENVFEWLFVYVFYK
ncbi:hypothetical protein F4825DRAFT_11718 [Nemania diffusa]|nr:hypothetical protein F4825DRAFT_11718 [Nemania diffusa]